MEWIFDNFQKKLHESSKLPLCLNAVTTSMSLLLVTRPPTLYLYYYIGKKATLSLLYSPWCLSRGQRGFSWVILCLSLSTALFLVVLKSFWNSSVIRQKGESQNGCFKKTKHVKFSEKTNISNPLIRTRTCAYQKVRNVRFFGKFDVLCFPETPVLRFAILPYYWRIKNVFFIQFLKFWKI